MENFIKNKVSLGATREKKVEKYAGLKRHRNFKSELFQGFVWLYSKMITPILLAVIFGCGGLIYYLTAVRGGLPILFVLALLYIAISSTIALFSSSSVDHHDGVELSREEAPEIWNVIDGISQHADCRPITRLVVDGELNAYATERRSGKLFGRGELEIGVGLPLLAALEPDEAASVIAHEIGHHNGDDARRSRSIYRAFERCHYMLDSAEDAYLTWLVNFCIFKPYQYGLMLMGQKLRHECEFEADRFAAQVCGVEATGKSDIALAVFGDDLSKVVFEPFQKALEEGTGNPEDLFDDLPARFRQALDSSTFKKKLAVALAEKTDFWSSHPSVSARLKNIGASPNLPAFDENRVAAKQWLGKNYAKVVDDVTQRWVEKYEQMDEMYQPIREYVQLNENIAKRCRERLVEHPNDPNALLFLAQAGSKIMDNEELDTLLKETLVPGVFNPEIEVMLANHEILQNDVNGISRLFNLIETKAEFQTYNALAKLEEWMEIVNDNDCGDCEEIKDVYDALFNSEMRSILKQLRKPVLEIQTQHLHCFEGEMKVAKFANWHREVLQNWLRNNPEIAKCWIFECTDFEKKQQPAYCVVFCFENQIKLDYFGGVDEADMPLRGIHAVTTFVSMEGLPKNIHKRVPPAVSEIIDDTQPFYDRFHDVNISDVLADSEAAEAA